MRDGQAAAYAPYVLTHYPQREHFDSISKAIVAFHVQHSGADAYAVARERLRRLIGDQRHRMQRKRDSLLRTQPGSASLSKLRRSGELLLAYAHKVSQGQEELHLDEQLPEGVVRIALDPHKSAVENAQEYFRRYDKAKSAAAELPRRLAQVDAELAYVDQLSTDLTLAQDRSGIAVVEGAMTEAGFLPKPRRRPKPPKTGPLRVLSEEGTVILVGRNSLQNEEVTFRRSSADDIWLHVQGLPGAHVVIRTGGRDVTEATLRRAAELAAHFSAAREKNTVAVDYTLRKNVRRLKRGRPGQVIYKGQRTVTVTPGR
jgi:predicted ribosome quality control (RQC) complex YloA/Tae2 family protein